MRFVALLLMTAVVVAQSEYENKNKRLPFRSQMKYMYQYATLSKVVCPLVPNKVTSIEIKGIVELFFLPSRGRNQVALMLKDPKLTFVVTPELSLIPKETQVSLAETLKSKLAYPVLFKYQGGKISNINLDRDVPVWIINIYRGIFNMLNVDMSKLRQNQLSTDFEENIHGSCKTMYMSNKRDEFVYVNKMIDGNRCQNLRERAWTTVVPEPTLTTPEYNANSLTTMTIKLFKKWTYFKIISANATGTVTLQPFHDVSDSIVSIANQSLVLLKEEPFTRKPFLSKRMKQTSLPMHIFMNQIYRQKIVLNKIIKRLVPFLRNLIIVTNKVTAPLPKEIVKEMTELVNILRTLETEELKTVWHEIVDTENKPELTKWFIHMLSLVKTENVLNIVASKLLEDEQVISKTLINEFLFMIGFSQFANANMVRDIKKICKIPSITMNTTILQTCIAAHVNVLKTHCGNMVLCRKPVPEILIKKLQFIAEMKSFSAPEMTEEEILKYLIIAETTESTTIFDVLSNIIKNNKLSVQVQVRAILALRPLTYKVKNRVLLPMLQIFKTISLPEEIRLAAFTVILERPDSRILMACVQLLIIEPCPYIRQHVYDSIMSLSESPLPKEMLEGVRDAREFIHTRRLIPVGLRLTPRRILEVIKPIPVPESPLKIRLRNQIHYVNKSILPRRILSKVDLPLMGKHINLMGIDLRLEGLEQLLNKVMGLMPINPKTMTPLQEKIKKLQERIATMPVVPEDLKLFLDLKMLGKPWMTLYKSIKMNESPMRSLFSGQLFNLMELIKTLDEGYDMTFVKPTIPVEVLLRLPTCNGITLDHKLTTIAFIRMKNKLRLKTTPSVMNLPAFLKQSMERAEMHLNFKHSHIISLTAAVFFELPIVRSGLQISKIQRVTLDTKLNIVTDLRTNNVSTEWVLPTAKEVIDEESELKHFIELRLKDKREMINDPVKPETILPKLIFINTVIPPEEKHDLVHLMLSSDKYLSALENKPALSGTPTPWVLIRHGKIGSIVTLYLPKVGYLNVDPDTMELEISKRIPTFWRLEYINKDRFYFKTLVPVSRTTLPTNYVEQLETLKTIMEVFRREEVECKEVERIHKMIYDDYLANEVDIRHLVIKQKKIELGNTEPALMQMKVIVPLERNLRNITLRNGTCFGETMHYKICMHGFVPVTNRMSLLQTFLSPMFFKIIIPSERRLEKLLMVSKITKPIPEVTVLKSIVSFIGNFPEKTFITTIRKRITNTIEHRHKLEMFVQDSASTEKLMCANIDYFRDVFNANVSLTSGCMVEHLRLKLEVPTTIPRYDLTFQVTSINKGIPTNVLENVKLIKRMVVLPLVRLPTSFMEKRFVSEILQYILKPIEESFLKNITTILKLHLPTPRLAIVEIKTPSRRVSYKVALPYSIEEIPMGTRSNPLMHKLPTLLQPVCVNTLNMFKTFDEVRYKYKIENFKCEHVLVQNCSETLPRFMVLLRKQTEKMRVVRIILQDSEIKFIPKSKTNVDIYIDNMLVTLNADNIMEKVLSSKMTVRIVFEPEINKLVLLNPELGLEVSLTAGRVVKTKVSPLLLGKVCGLCGDINSEPNNKFITPQRRIVKNADLFGISWMVPGTDCTTDCALRLTTDVILRPNLKLMCKPLIRIPACKSRCSATIRRKIFNVPVKCQNEDRIVDVVVPADCDCNC